MNAFPAARPFSNTSRHARQRLHQRCKVDERNVLQLLDAGAYVDLGRKPGCDRHHLLFWSNNDNAARVAIRDRHTGTLVTVLPPDYNAWSVSDADVALAKRRAAQRNSGEGRLRLKAHFIDADGGLKTSSVWHSDLTETPADSAVIAAFVAKHRWLQGWRKALVDAGIGPEHLMGLSLRRGRAGDRLDVPEAIVATLRRKLASHR